MQTAEAEPAKDTSAALKTETAATKGIGEENGHTPAEMSKLAEEKAFDADKAAPGADDMDVDAKVARSSARCQRHCSCIWRPPTRLAHASGRLCLRYEVIRVLLPKVGHHWSLCLGRPQKQVERRPPRHRRRRLRMLLLPRRPHPKRLPRPQGTRKPARLPQPRRLRRLRQASPSSWSAASTPKVREIFGLEKRYRP